MLDSIDFTRTGAYLLRENGYWRLEYCDLITRRSSCPIFAPLVDEDEIEITGWDGRYPEIRKGLWEGREVKLWMACTDLGIKNLETITRAYHALRGLNVTANVLGHVVRGKHVVGIMTDVLRGRVPTYYDRSAVFEVLAKVQQAGLIYRQVGDGGFIIEEDGVKLPWMTTFLFVEDPVERASLAQRWHWDLGQGFFERLKFSSAFDEDEIAPPVIDIPRMPSPQRPIRVYVAYLYCPDSFDRLPSFLDSLLRGFASYARMPRQRTEQGKKRRAFSDLPAENKQVTFRRAASDTFVDAQVQGPRRRLKKEDIDDREMREMPARPCLFQLKTIYQPYDHSQLSITWIKEERSPTPLIRWR
ncbi:hypothetical protein PUNSTDRAFT_47000 [Punctularia strigosozonata HHB-11173 SS5]|uniref:Uncharacterized protein n=1 Tax=Punctularia strigosozonata (strain HHB-11173) TaxID=741275 RepID=R7S5W1_PUNST|nr:uncharacterized protein PUNSTDRAFT_47000 [Punctularia strigosozonata HHB-11173 SS5]EIN05156.1 hypothetical protein PUNSTDRAFT_47000 [Punctularia strigosozonata HHB-11173 SS5]